VGLLQCERPLQRFYRESRLDQHPLSRCQLQRWWRTAIDAAATAATAK
jgi:hypothetical protein